MKNILIQQDLYFMVDVVEKKPKDMSTEMWMVLDEKAMSSIKLHLYDEVICNVMKEKSAKGTWEKLERRDCRRLKAEIKEGKKAEISSTANVVSEDNASISKEAKDDGKRGVVTEIPITTKISDNGIDEVQQEVILEEPRFIAQERLRRVSKPLHRSLGAALDRPTSSTIDTWVQSVVVMSHPCPLALSLSTVVHSQDLPSYVAPSLPLSPARHQLPVPATTTVVPPPLSSQSVVVENLGPADVPSS
ncbi:hypothetical protein LWI28_025144 [Acer negundo]|uniref:Uncharacterized protein n=1 Tax=Acer negundo TaxID=4023 RepID=A0AAD5JMY3_ACENE|nr:hypothetical protein LWI28_025144 [Acer negundo]